MAVGVADPALSAGDPSGVAGTLAPVALPVAAPPPVVPVAPVTATPAIVPALAQDSVAQQGAALAEGDAANAAGEANAAAHGDAEARYEAQAEELRQTQERQARAADEAHRQTTAALDAARDKHIPDFWAGREGKRTEMAVMVGLGGVAQGLLGLATNNAAEIVKENVDGYYRREKEKVDNLFKYAEKKGDAEGQLRAQHASELAGLQAKYGATKLAIAAHIDKQVALGQGRVDKAKAAALSTKLRTEGQDDILKAKATLAEINLRNAEAQRAREERKGSSPAATAAEAHLAEMIEQGVPASQVRAAAAKAGVKPQRVDALENQGRAAAKGGALEQAAQEKADAKKTAADEATAVRDGAGRVRGYAPTARNVKAFEDRVVQYDDAVDALNALKASGKTVPYGDLYDRAVLAVAATTQANASDKTTAHEAGTLKNWGLISADAISRTLEHVQTRQTKFMNQLRPVDDAGGSAPAGGGDMVTIKSAKTGESKQVTRVEAKRLGAI